MDNASMTGLWVRAILLLGDLHRRLLTAFLGVIGPRWSYRLMEWAATLLYGLLDVIRERGEAQCRAALGGLVSDEEVPRIARQSFVNRAWNLTDLMLASRYLRASTYGRYGGRISEPWLARLIAAQRDSKPVILITAYFGSYDLFPVFLGYNGIRAAVAYLPHSNANYDQYRRLVRGQSGCELVPVSEAAARFADVLGRGGTVALVADHNVEHRGTPVTFLGIETKALRSVGLLAWRYQAEVVVAGIRRLDKSFNFEIVVTDVVHRNEVAAHDDAVALVTGRYLRALEQLILSDPTQYMWAYARWGEERARQAVADFRHARGS